MFSSTAAMQSLVASMSELSDRETRIANQISSGLRISSLSDDAVAAGQAVTMAGTLRTDDAFTATAGSVGSRMQAADTALSSVVTQMTSAISTATSSLNGTMNSANQQAAMQALSSVRDTLFSLANSSYGGAYLFGGTSTQTPFTMDAHGAVTYTGSAGTTSVTTPNGTSIATSVAGSSIFTASGSDVFAALNNILSALQSGTTTDSATLVGDLRNALDTVTSQRSALNTAQNRLSSESDYVTQQVTTLKAQQGTLLSANTADLATELSAVTTQRSALLSTIAAVQKGSLFDYL